nr:hypothetical protein [Actinomycetota bacterium]
IQDLTPLAETAATSRPASADLLAVLSTDVGLEAIQRAIAAVTVPSIKPSKAAILAALQSVVA